MPKLSPKGFAPILIIIILFLGLVAGLYLMGRPQIFKPKATSEAPGNLKNAFLDQAQAADEDGNRVVFKSDNLGIDQSPRYLVEYQSPTDLFRLIINDVPLEVVRAEAERDLLQKAGDELISLCSLQFIVFAPATVTEDGLGGADDKLAICRQYQIELENSQLGEQQSSILARVKAVILSFLQGKQEFLSDSPIVASENLPPGAYISLCRNNGTDAEGVWQVSSNPLVADFINRNQKVPRCSEPVPNYLVFTEPVPVGAYLSMCINEEGASSSKQWVWQVNESGRITDDPYIQDGCTPAPSIPQNTQQAFSRLLTVQSATPTACPVPGGNVKTPSYQANNTTGHCGGGYGYACNCGTTGRRAKAIDVKTYGKPVILPTVYGQPTKWKLITGPYEIKRSEGGGYGYTFEATVGPDKWYLDVGHLNRSALSLGSQYPSGTAVGTTAAGHVHTTIGKNLSRMPEAGSITDCDPNWLPSDFMCNY